MPMINNFMCRKWAIPPTRCTHRKIANLPIDWQKCCHNITLQKPVCSYPQVALLAQNNDKQISVFALYPDSYRFKIKCAIDAVCNMLLRNSMRVSMPNGICIRFFFAQGYPCFAVSNQYIWSEFIFISRVGRYRSICRRVHRMSYTNFNEISPQMEKGANNKYRVSVASMARIREGNIYEV